ncbi:MAG: ribosome-associated translation inhibitor RaiA [Bacillota bacterium]
MRIEFISRNYKESNKIIDIIEKKMTKLDKFFDEDATAKIQLSGLKNDRFTMEISIKQIGMSVPVRAETTSGNMYENIDILIPKLERQMRKYRTRIEARKHKIKGHEVIEEAAPAEIEALSKVVKVKSFNISIITVDDAIAELELLDHNFYVFVDAETNKVSVVYKRNDGNYGLISPEY